jgi:hypothetical protein
MVAYNFKSAFHERLIDGTKRQTVRHQGGRRHARPGEPVQIYTGMRTKHARKLIDDPLCLGIDSIVIQVGRRAEDCVAGIEINGIPLSRAEMATFAVADGFDGLAQFGRFWLMTHGEGQFEGVVIRW